VELERAALEMRNLAQHIQENEIKAMELHPEDVKRVDLEMVISSDLQLLKNLAIGTEDD
jgi:hypothetical protein